jgi:hypothetical protein
MRIFSRTLQLALACSFLASAVYASDGIYDHDLVRGFLSIKGDFRSMKSDGVRYINDETGLTAIKRSYAKNYLDGHVEIGAEYDQLRTWFDIDFMPITPTREDTEWFSYGFTWMWGYKLWRQNSAFNIIPSAGPGVELQNIRPSKEKELESLFGPTLNLELELRFQHPQLSAGIYGGYKVVRHYNGYRDINADKVFVGLKLSWTMLNNYQKKERDLL